jgi:hypothetical protein
MVGRILVTTIVLLLAAGAFWGDALGAGHVFNPVGILLLTLSFFIWAGWTTVRDAFISAKEESNVPIIRLGPAIIRGMEGLKHAPQPRRSSSP